MSRQAETARAMPLTLTLAVTVVALSLLEPAGCIEPRSGCIVSEGRSIRGQEAFQVRTADVHKLFGSLFQKKQRLPTGRFGPMKGNQSVVGHLSPRFHVEVTLPVSQAKHLVRADDRKSAPHMRTDDAELAYKAGLPILPSPRPALQPATSRRTVLMAQRRSKRAAPCANSFGYPDGTSRHCCMTCRYWRYFHHVYIDGVIWYVVHFPYGYYQWIAFGECGTATPRTCKRCVQESKYHTLLVSHQYPPYPETILVRLVLVEFKAYCRCAG